MLENKYNTEKAKEYRKKLDEITAKCAELQYNLFCLQKEGRELGEEYAIYLGVKEKKETKEGENGKV